MIIAKYLRKGFIGLTAVCFFSLGASAQVKFTTVLSSTEIGRGDFLQVEFIVENANQIDNLVPPAFPNFKIAEGPIQSSGMSIVNGNTSQYKGISYVLQPLKTGKYTIEGATAKVDGKLMHSNPVSVEVTKAAKIFPAPTAMQPIWPGESTQPDKDYILKPGERIEEKIKKNIFLRVQADKTSCYVGEPVVVTYKLYSRLRSESRVTKRPSLNGFSVYDMVDPSNDAETVETINGKQFVVHLIRKAQVIPLQPGTIDLDPAEVDNKVYFVKQSTAPRKRVSVLDELFGQSASEQGEEVDQNITLQSQPLSITVKPLPELNKPSDFNGAVGHFTLEAQIERKKMAAHDAGTLKLVVKGSGNLPIVNAPQVNWPDSIEAYDPTAKENVDNTIAPLSGTKTFEYVFTPEKQGKYKIDPIAFSYFDPSSATYKTIESQPLEMEVVPSAVQKSNLFVSTAANGSKFENFFQHYLEWLLALLVLTGLAVYLWRQNARLRKMEQPAKPPVEPSPIIEEKGTHITLPEPVDPFLRAKRMLAGSDYTGFYRELSQSLWDTLRDELKIPSSELNKQNISNVLNLKGWDGQTITALENILNECEINLYTPDHNENNMYQMLEQAEKITKCLKQG